MSVVWLCLSVYLIVGAVALLEADVRARPGHRPTVATVCWAALVFALTRPAVQVGERFGLRI